MMVKYTVHGVFGFGTMFFVSKYHYFVGWKGVKVCCKKRMFVSHKGLGFCVCQKVWASIYVAGFWSTREFLSKSILMIFSTTKVSKNANVINITQFLVGTYTYINPVYPVQTWIKYQKLSQ